jgi:hypothetical protein
MSLGQSCEHAQAIGLFDPLLSFLCICEPSSAETTFMSGDKGTKNFILPHLTNRFVITFGSPRSRIQLWPVDLLW